MNKAKREIWGFCETGQKKKETQTQTYRMNSMLILIFLIWIVKKKGKEKEKDACCVSEKRKERKWGKEGGSLNELLYKLVKKTKLSMLSYPQRKKEIFFG